MYLLYAQKTKAILLVKKVMPDFGDRIMKILESNDSGFLVGNDVC